MFPNTRVRSARSVSTAIAAVLLATSVGSASALPAASATDTGVAGPPGSATAVPASSRVALHAPAVAHPTRAVAQRAVRLARAADFARFTLASPQTRDMRGVERSLYRGRYFRPAVESRRQCIARRESEGHYDVVSRSGLYFGAYQVSRELARGATWMMLKEHRVLMGDRAARTVLARLRAKPMNTWPRYWQDAAFSTVMNWEHTGSGSSHWAGGRWHC